MTALPPSSFASCRRQAPGNTPGQDWLDQVFRAKSVTRGGVVLRKLCDVEREIGLAALEVEVRRRGFHMLQSGEQVIILCSPAPFTVIC